MADEDTTVEQKAPFKGEQCWNCKNQNRRTGNRLDEAGNCAECGFSKNSDSMYNGNLEADKAAQRVELTRQALNS
jgi:hypothetical protein